MSNMEVDSGAEFSEVSFRIGRCEECARDVLTFPGFEPGDDRVYCVHCEKPVAEGLRDAAGDDLPDHGYGLLELQGCGNAECGGGACSRKEQEESAAD